MRWDRLAVVALLIGAVWWGGREVRSVVRTARPFERASAPEMFRYGLFTLYGSPHAPFLYRVHQVVGHGRVLLRLPGECPGTPVLATTDGWGLAYALLPASVTCDRTRADYELVFGVSEPTPPGRLLIGDDATHALYRLQP